MHPHFLIAQCVDIFILLSLITKMNKTLTFNKPPFNTIVQNHSSRF